MVLYPRRYYSAVIESRSSGHMLKSKSARVSGNGARLYIGTLDAPDSRFSLLNNYLAGVCVISSVQYAFAELQQDMQKTEI
jgi:hypothetical protein